MLLFQDKLFYSLNYKYRHFILLTHAPRQPLLSHLLIHLSNIFRSCIGTYLISTYTAMCIAFVYVKKCLVIIRITNKNNIFFRISSH